MEMFGVLILQINVHIITCNAYKVPCYIITYNEKNNDNYTNSRYNGGNTGGHVINIDRNFGIGVCSDKCK